MTIAYNLELCKRIYLGSRHRRILAVGGEEDIRTAQLPVLPPARRPGNSGQNLASRHVGGCGPHSNWRHYAGAGGQRFSVAGVPPQGNLRAKRSGLCRISPLFTLFRG
jgi:hypothetical protein